MVGGEIICSENCDVALAQSIFVLQAPAQRARGVSLESLYHSSMVDQLCKSILRLLVRTYQTLSLASSSSFFTLTTSSSSLNIKSFTTFDQDHAVASRFISYIQIFT